MLKRRLTLNHGNVHYCSYKTDDCVYYVLIVVIIKIFNLMYVFIQLGHCKAHRNVVR